MRYKLTALRLALACLCLSTTAIPFRAMADKEVITQKSLAGSNNCASVSMPSNQSSVSFTSYVHPREDGNMEWSNNCRAIFIAPDEDKIRRVFININATGNVGYKKGHSTVSPDGNRSRKCGSRCQRNQYPVGMLMARISGYDNYHLVGSCRVIDVGYPHQPVVIKYLVNDKRGGYSDNFGNGFYVTTTVSTEPFLNCPS